MLEQLNGMLPAIVANVDQMFTRNPLVTSAVVRILKVLFSIPEHSLLPLVSPAKKTPAPATHWAHVWSPAAIHGSHVPIMHLGMGRVRGA